MEELIIIDPRSCEYFCHDCGQLCLWAFGKEAGRPEKPDKCQNCESENIEIGELESTHLTKLRKEWRRDAKTTKVARD